MTRLGFEGASWVEALRRSHPDLAASIPLVERYLASAWERPLLSWFTDHGPSHALRVANYAVALLDLHPESEFTPLEYYVTSVGALLHDMGMQELRSGTPLDQHAPDDFTFIRREHPRKSYDVITLRAAEIGLPADPFLIEAIATVAKAHGTAYYANSVSDLRHITRIRNEYCRTPLIASIVLMADEFDLHYSRAFSDPERANVSAVSRAHHYKHLYVAAVDVSRIAPAGVKLALTFAFPNALAASAKRIFMRWITVKLQQQMALVAPTVTEWSNGFIRFDRAILVKEVPPPATLAIADSRSFAIAREDVTRADLLDYTVIVRELGGYASTGESFLLIASGEEVAAREDLLDWYISRASIIGKRVLLSDRVALARGGAVRDILVDWLVALQPDAQAATEIEKLLDQLVGAATIPPGVVLVVSSIDLLTREDQTWLLGRCLPRLLARKDVQVVASSDNSHGLAASGVRVVRIGTADPEEVVSFFRRFGDEDYGTRYLMTQHGYSALRRLAVRHEEELLT